MVSRSDVQYTIRKIPARVDEALRQRARREKKSLNAVAVEALASAAGVSEEITERHDLDSLVGTWVEDEEFEEAIRAQDQIDSDSWR
jgi:hypothetical protein